MENGCIERSLSRIGGMIEELEGHRAALRKACDKADGMHDSPEKLAEFLTGPMRDIMLKVRTCCDALEMALPDESWPLPKYREMLVPV